MKSLQHITEGLFDVEDSVKAVDERDWIIACLKGITYFYEEVIEMFSFETKGNILYITQQSSTADYFPLGTFIAVPSFPNSINEVVFKVKKEFDFLDIDMEVQNPKSPVRKVTIIGDVKNICEFPPKTEVIVKGDIKQTNTCLMPYQNITCNRLIDENSHTVTGYKRFELHCDEFITGDNWGMMGDWVIKDGDEIIARNKKQNKHVFLCDMNLKDLQPGKVYDVVPEDDSISQKFKQVCKMICTKPFIKKVIFQGSDRTSRYQWVLTDKKSYIERTNFNPITSRKAIRGK